MRSVVVLCRHGNTFARGEKVVMVGAKEDLPLTDEGLRQAADVGAALRSIAPRIERIISGPLLRTKVFAEVLKRSCGSEATISIDVRLTELDYGEWSGLSNEEIVALAGEAALREWQENGIRPTQARFYPSEQVVADETAALLRDFEGCSGVTVVVSSNGRLREFRRLVETSLDGVGRPQADGKVRTGGSCVLVASEGVWNVAAWNCDAKSLELVLAEIQ